MSAKRKTAERRGPGRPRAGRVKTMLSLDPAHVAALREEALRRAREQGSLRPDASAIVREVLDAWLVTRRGR